MSELINASKAGRLDIVRCLIEQCHYDVNCTEGEDSYCALYWAACNGHPALVFYLLSNEKIDVNKSVKWGSTPLHAASERGHRDCVIHLCKGDAVINCQNYNHLDTPLHLAAYRGHLDVCKILLHYGANMTIQNKQSKTCLDEAHGQRKYDVYEYLLKYLQGNKQNSIHSMKGTNDDISINISDQKPKSVAVNPKTVSEPIIPYLTPAVNSSKSRSGHNGKTWPNTDTGKGAPSQAQYLQNKILADILNGKNQSDIRTPIENVSDFFHTDKEVHEYKQRASVKEVNSYKYNSANGHGQFNSSYDKSKERKINHQGNQVHNPVTYTDHIIEQKHDISENTETLLPQNQTCIHTHEPIKYNDHEDILLNPQYSPEILNHYIKMTESLHFQLIKERDKTAFLEKKHVDLWTECENYRGRLKDQQNKLGIYLKYEKRYKKAIEENERLKVRLEESDQRSRSLAQLVYKYQTAPTNISEEAPVVSKQKNNNKMDNMKKDDGVSIKTGVKGYQSSTSSSSDSDKGSQDSLTRHILSSGASITTSHSDLYKAILPVFQAMGGAFQRTMCKSLRDKLMNSLPCPKETSLDELGKEWVSGEHYILTDEYPINRQNQVEGSCSLVFRIEHHQSPYILKMMINLLDVSQTKHGSGQSYPLYLHQHFSPEHDIPTLLPPHENIVPVLHYYNGSTLCFKHLISACYPPGLNDSIEMANETTFIVMPEYPTTLGLFIDVKLQRNDPLPEIFILQKLYETLSAVSHLHDNKVVHRDIKANNIFLDHKLRIVLGDFGFARRFQNNDGSAIPFVEKSQAVAGNSDAWPPELAAMNNQGPESLQTKLTLEDIYHTTDSYAVGKMFYKLLCYRSQDAVVDPYMIELPECYSPELRTLIYLLKHPDVNHRLTAHRGRVLTGLMLFGPQSDEVKNESECHIWHHAKMMKLLVQNPVSNSLPDATDFVLNVTSSISVNEDLLERNFFITFPAEEIWTEYEELQTYKHKY